MAGTHAQFADSSLHTSTRRCRQHGPRPTGALPAETSRSSSAFGGAQFWGVLRAGGVEGEVRALLAECKGATRRRGGLPLLIEADLKLARFLAGLHVSQRLSTCWPVLLKERGGCLRTRAGAVQFVLLSVLHTG